MKSPHMMPDIRFMKKIKKTKTCWIWTAAKNSFGHGSFKLNGAMIGAHRFSYEKFKGKILNGLCVCHTCDIPSCVNPDHLFLGTKKDNIRDCINKKRFKSNRGEKNPNCKLTDKKVILLRRDYLIGMTPKMLINKYKIKYAQVYRITRGLQRSLNE